MLPHLTRLPEMASVVGGEKSESRSDAKLEELRERRNDFCPADIDAVGSFQKLDQLLIGAEKPFLDLRRG